MRYIIRGDDKFGIVEDFIELLVVGNDKLLTYVVNGRDVDEVVKSRPDLDQSFFPEVSGDPIQEIKTPDEFQKLVDEHFQGQDIAGWFSAGISCADSDEEDDDDDESCECCDDCCEHECECEEDEEDDLDEDDKDDNEE